MWLVVSGRRWYLMGVVCKGCGCCLSGVFVCRYVSVTRRKQQSAEEPARATRQQVSRNHRKSREMEDIDIGTFPRSPLAGRDSCSLRHKRPAPAPPTVAALRDHRAVTLGRRPQQRDGERDGERGKNRDQVTTGTTQRPVRKAPLNLSDWLPPSLTR